MNDETEAQSEVWPNEPESVMYPEPQKHGAPWWTWIAIGLILLALIAVLVIPGWRDSDRVDALEEDLSTLNAENEEAKAEREALAAGLNEANDRLIALGEEPSLDPATILGQIPRPEPGEPGEQGEQGQQGIEGQQGARGEKGETGEQGEQGIQGETGSSGADGAAGTNGVSVASVLLIEQSSGTCVFRFTFSDGGTQDTQSFQCQGPQGATGPQGPQGEPGDPCPGGELVPVTINGPEGQTDALVCVSQQPFE